MGANASSYIFLACSFSLSIDSAFAHAAYPVPPVQHVLKPIAKILPVKAKHLYLGQYSHTSSTSSQLSALLSKGGTRSLIRENISANAHAYFSGELSTGAARYLSPPGSTILNEVLLDRLNKQVVLAALKVQLITSALREIVVQKASLQVMILHGTDAQASAKAMQQEALLTQTQQQLMLAQEQAQQILNAARASLAAAGAALALSSGGTAAEQSLAGVP